jgi:molybdenum cofactor synthesis domain-containing protein
MEQRGFGFMEENLLSPEDAVATFLARVDILQPAIERVGIDEALGRILGELVVADRDYPDAPRSAMDGFAVRAADAPGTLPVDGEIHMGAAWSGPLAPGHALRIPTGGVVPDGADTIVPIEDVSFDGSAIEIIAPLERGANVHPVASDMRGGETVLEPGMRLGAPHVGVLAALGVTSVPVLRRPRIAVISSGDELVPVDRRPELGQIRDSNRYAIAAALQAMGADPVHRAIVRDDPGALEAELREAIATHDAVVVSGGSSVGERDSTPQAVEALGPPGVIVHGLRVKPGKPTVLGAAGERPIIGLPGNPTSALMILEAVAAPLIAALTGSRRASHGALATLGGSTRSRRGWTWYVPVALRHEAGALVAQPLPLRSSMVSLTARADGFIVMPESVGELEAGTLVTVHRFL